jgi:hypothetical protein
MAKSKVNAVLQRIKRILTGVFQGLKLKVFHKKKQPQPLRKKKTEGKKGKTVVKNTKQAQVKFAAYGGEIAVTKPKRPYTGKKKDGVVAIGCGAILSDRKKHTKGSVST